MAWRYRGGDGDDARRSRTRRKELDGTGRDGRRGESADPRRRPRQGRRREDREEPAKKPATLAEKMLGMHPGDAPDGPGREEGSAVADRRDAADREGTLPRASCWIARYRGLCSWLRRRAAWKSKQVAAKNPDAIIKEYIDPAIGFQAVPGAEDRVQARARARSSSRRR